jgi:hypothetical protein
VGLGVSHQIGVVKKSIACGELRPALGIRMLQPSFQRAMARTELAPPREAAGGLYMMVLTIPIKCEQEIRISAA